MIRRADPKGAAAVLRGMADRSDLTSILPSIRVATLVIVGDQDAISPPEEMRAMAADIPNARFVIAPRSGHMAPMEAPDLVNRELLAFLQTT
jgi:pimeloyl-ACP methyl ester carboxylesterase